MTFIACDAKIIFQPTLLDIMEAASYLHSDPHALNFDVGAAETNEAARVAAIEAALNNSTEQVIKEAIFRQPELAVHQEALVELLNLERQSRKDYLASNIVDSGYFKQFVKGVDLRLTYIDRMRDAIGEIDEVKVEAWRHQVHAELLQAPLRAIDQNAHLPIAEKLALIRQKPWRVLPISYFINVADWRATAELDAQVATFAIKLQEEGGNIVVPPKNSAPRKTRLGSLSSDEKLLTVVRTREIAWINNDDNPQLPTAAAHDIALRKRSVFALEVDRLPKLGERHKIEDQLNVLVSLRPQIASNAFAWSPDNDAQIGQLVTSIAQADADLLIEVENLINEQRDGSPLITLATSYNFRQRSIPKVPPFIPPFPGIV